MGLRFANVAAHKQMFLSHIPAVHSSKANLFVPELCPNRAGTVRGSVLTNVLRSVSLTASIRSQEEIDNARSLEILCDFSMS